MSRSTVETDGFHIDGKRFVILGAEIHNSSSSTVAAINESFARVRELGANTVLAPVSWDLLERAEGTFDFSLVDAMLRAAGETGLRLVPLWFGAWKNGMSTYAPRWVKTDTARFVRSETSEFGPIEHLSPFCPDTVAADANAFAMLLAHLKTTDIDNTVILVQVENEVGLLGDARDRCALAQAAWTSAVPRIVVDAIERAVGTPTHDAWLSKGAKRTGSWPELYGDSPQSSETFMTYAYSSAVGRVAAAGRAQLQVPLFVNAWLDQEITVEIGTLGAPEFNLAGGSEPGKYPSGGPLPRHSTIWRACAPAIDFSSPDLYYGDFAAIGTEYKSSYGLLFIPEMRRSELGAAQMCFALGEIGAVGVSPFGVDSTPAGSADESALRDGYRFLAAAADLLRIAPSVRTRGFILAPDRPTATLDVGDFTVNVKSQEALEGNHHLGYGIVIDEGAGQIVLLGRAFSASFARNDGKKTGILSCTQLDFDGSWSTVLEMNGDETGGGTSVRLPSRDAGKAPSIYPIPFLTRSSGIVRVSLYEY